MNYKADEGARVSRRRLSTATCWMFVLLTSAGAAACGGSKVGTKVPLTRQSAVENRAAHPEFASPQLQSIALSPNLRELYVANTAADTLDVIDVESRKVIRRIDTGVDPISVAVRPDGLEVWVSNHVSDSVSVIDVNPRSSTRYHVIDVVQAFDRDGLVTDFDEPAGIAFASNEKAYVALSSRNRIAVVDVPKRAVTKQLSVPAQDPRAIRVRNGMLFVIPFESTNQTELSGCIPGMRSDSPECSFSIPKVLKGNRIDAVLTRTYKGNILRNPHNPDADLFIYDTGGEKLLSKVSHLGTMLYGIAVDSRNRVFISNTEARNDANGKAAEGHNLLEMENRAFLNRVTRIDCGEKCAEPSMFELDPPLPAQPAAGEGLAVPYGVEISADDSTLVAVAASSHRLFTVDANTGQILGRVDVGAVPRSLVLESDAKGAPARAWVFNAVEDSVSVVDVANPNEPRELGRIALFDPTEKQVKHGRILFNDANASSSGTFSCESCHPDGNTDQLLWNLGSKCTAPGCAPAVPRTTMPIRGLRDTLPLHWDGLYGDPYGGKNGEVTWDGPDVPPNCTNEHACFRHLVNNTLAGTMCDQRQCPKNDEGLAGLLSAKERDDLASFLMSVPYPPARSRRLDDKLSASAMTGFETFLRGDDAAHLGCARAGGLCHAAPFWAGTNTPGSGLDSPTMRGLTDRFLLLPNGRANELDLFNYFAFAAPDMDVRWDVDENGFDELYAFAIQFGSPTVPTGNRVVTGGDGPLDVWQFLEESTTGFSGAFGRQATLNKRTTTVPERDRSIALLSSLEAAHNRGGVYLQGHGVRDRSPLAVVYKDGGYAILDQTGQIRESLARKELIERAAAGEFIVTLTGQVRNESILQHPQPALWPPAASRNLTFVDRFTGMVRPDVPDLARAPVIDVFARHLTLGSKLLIDGEPSDAVFGCTAEGSFPNCKDESVRIQLAKIPSDGTHYYQVALPSGLMSNELLVDVNWKGWPADEPVVCGGIQCQDLYSIGVPDAARAGSYHSCCTADNRCGRRTLKTDTCTIDVEPDPRCGTIKFAGLDAPGCCRADGECGIMLQGACMPMADAENLSLRPDLAKGERKRCDYQSGPPQPQVEPVRDLFANGSCLVTMSGAH